ncbi:MAG: hypothetical protein WKG06_15995 [Segetibacter sp.]
MDDTTMAWKEAKVELPSPKTPEEDQPFQEVIKKSGKAKAAQQAMERRRQKQMLRKWLPKFQKIWIRLPKPSSTK